MAHSKKARNRDIIGISALSKYFHDAKFLKFCYDFEEDLCTIIIGIESERIKLDSSGDQFSYYEMSFNCNQFIFHNRYGDNHGDGMIIQKLTRRDKERLKRSFYYVSDKKYLIIFRSVQISFLVSRLKDISIRPVRELDPILPPSIEGSSLRMDERRASRRSSIEHHPP